MSSLKRVIAHWSVTRYKADQTSKAHYHFIVEGDGNVVAGDKKPEDNISTRNGYAAHTLGCNTGSIGIACAAMSGATGVTNFGDYPITEIQFNSMCRKIAELCIRYGIEPGPRTVLSHAEVQGTLGIKQRGKWDIAVLPFAGLTTAKACGDLMRRRVSLFMLGKSSPRPIEQVAESPAMADERIAWLQRLLVSLGYDLGKVDGVVGPKTRAATLAFQKSEGVHETSELDRDTVDVLRKKAGA